jgi:hypothetical protein
VRVRHLWEWLVGHVWWTCAPLVAITVIFSDEMNPSNPLGWSVIGLFLVFVWVPGGERMRRILLEQYRRP